MLFRLLYRTKHSLETPLSSSCQAEFATRPHGDFFAPQFTAGVPSRSRSRQRFRWVLALVPTLFPLANAHADQHCLAVTFEGVVTQGQAYTHPLTPALDFKLEAVPAGWMVRVLAHGAPRPLHDAAELANPPYRSPTPILISTDFAFRAQDAIAWNPRTFRFFTSSFQVAAAEEAYQATLRDPFHPAAGAALYPLLARAREATLQILDAEIAGGTANQTAAAATVATHFAETAHTVRADLPPTPLGTILGLRFRVTLPASPTCH